MPDLSAKQAKFAQELIHTWKETKALSTQNAEKLEASIHVIPFDWQKLAKYSFWVAIICCVISVTTIVTDKALMILLMKVLQVPAIVKIIALCGVSVGLYIGAFVRKKRKPSSIYSNEAITLLAMLSTAGTVAYMGKVFGNVIVDISFLMLMACFIYAFVAILAKSKLVWIFALISLGGWLGASTGYNTAGMGSYSLGMDYPIVFVFFGGVLIALGQLLKSHGNKAVTFFSHSTYVMGLIYIFMALWMLSIFGDRSNFFIMWDKTSYAELVFWAVLFAAISIATIFYGIKRDCYTSRSFGITFLFINLYTRYFEFFWNTSHKAIFFGVLAISFWYLGTRAEKIWHIGEKKKA